MILGYKCFKENLTNVYGLQFEVGRTYSVDGEIGFGNNGNGYHMCKNMEDTFRYYDTFSEDVCLCEVIGIGDICSYEDDYNGYYDMYSVQTIKIVRVLSRKEIINIGLNLNEIRVCRFIQLFRLLPNEILLFKNRFVSYPMVLKFIAYYQEGDKLAFNTSRKLSRKYCSYV